MPYYTPSGYSGLDQPSNYYSSPIYYSPTHYHSSSFYGKPYGSSYNSSSADAGEFAKTMLLVGVVGFAGVGLYKSFNQQELQRYKTNLHGWLFETDKGISTGYRGSIYTCSMLPTVDTLDTRQSLMTSRLCGVLGLTCSTTVFILGDKMSGASIALLSITSIASVAAQHHTLPLQYRWPMEKEEYRAAAAERGYQSAR